MARKPTPRIKRLSHKLTTRVNDKTFEHLSSILQRNDKIDMSTLIRHILENRKVKVYVHDETLDNWIDELSQLRGEIRAIGININQITRHFNTYPEPIRKASYATMAFEEYQKVQPRIEAIWSIVAKLSEKWLSG